MRKNIFIFTIIISVVAGALLIIHEYGNTIGQTDISVSYRHVQATKNGTAAQVARAIDGDTIELTDGERLRYIGIDTPEEVNAYKSVQCFAREAHERNKELVEGKKITFYNDISDHDVYGRLLGFVYLPDGTFVNKLLVTQGYAFAYPYKPDISKAQEFLNAETAAKKNNLGLWKMCVVRVLPSGREQTHSVQ